MLKAGIIDPTKVTRVALENAASVAGMILTTECALIDIKEENRWRFNGWRYARNDVKSKKTYYIKSSFNNETDFLFIPYTNTAPKKIIRVAIESATLHKKNGH
jgi:hypothetical protein